MSGTVAGSLDGSGRSSWSGTRVIKGQVEAVATAAATEIDTDVIYC